jgi:hypothetical protein
MKHINKFLLSFAYAALLLVTSLQSTSTAFALPNGIRTDSEVILSAEKSAEITAQLPITFRQLLEDETQNNPYFYGDESRIVEFSVTRQERLDDVESLVRLGGYDPRQGLWFYLPHLEIPFEDFDHLNISPSISEDMKDLYFFTKGRKKYVRYFLHPFRELKNYTTLAKKYALKYEYLSRPISSPRSMIVIKAGEPSHPRWVKVSLGLTMSALQRRQKPEKLARALMVNEALEMIPQEKRDELQLDWLNESFAAQLPGKDEVIIGRDAKSFEVDANSKTSLRPTFSFFHSPDGKKKPDIKALIQKSGLKEVEFFKKYFLTPAIRNLVYLAFEEGILWSMHTGNYYTEVDAEGMPTGKINIKDFDGAAFDPEMRMLRGKPFEGIHQMSENPFSDAWFAAATGRSNGERQRLGYVYSLYVRDVYGFNSIASYMFSYLTNWGSRQGKGKAETRKIVEQAIDEITINEIRRYTGLEVSKTSLAKGVGTDAGINSAYNERHDLNYDQFKKSDAKPELQKPLQAEFIRLMKLNRTWASFSRTDVTAAKTRLRNKNVVLYYHEHAGMIQVRSYSPKDDTDYAVIGYALIEDPRLSDKQSDFLKSIGASAPANKAFEVNIEKILKAQKSNSSKKGKTQKCIQSISWLDGLSANLLLQV